jgi:hypothetical protein
VDLNSIGRASNAHAAATFLGMFAYAVAGGSTMLLVVLGARILDRPALVPALMLVWCAVCFVVARLLFVPVRQLLARRRENLAQVPSRPK